MEKVHKIILGVLAAVLAVLVGLTAYVALTMGPAADPGFTPPPFDPDAQKGAPAEPDKALIYTELAIREGFVVSLCGSPVVDDSGRATVYFTAHPDNTLWVRLLVQTEDGVDLGATGLLRPGEYVEAVQLSKAPADGTTLVFKILSYQPETYYSEGSAKAQVIARHP